MAVEIEQGEVFAARRQRSVPIEPMMIHIHDALVAPVGVHCTSTIPPSLVSLSSRSCFALPGPDRTAAWAPPFSAPAFNSLETTQTDR